MKKTFAIIAMLSVLVGCQPKDKPQEIGHTSIPENIAVDVDNGKMTVSWTRRGSELITGYYIYISESPVVAEYPSGNYPESVKPFNLTVFPGDTDPEDGIEHFIAEGLENGKKYYVSVRIVFPDRVLSKPSDEILAVPGPRGEITMDTRYNGDHDGYSFSGDTYVRADASSNDVYFFSQGGKDYLVSPTRLDGFLRATKLEVLPLRGDTQEVPRKVNQGVFNPSSDRVEVSKGQWILIKTPESQHVLVKVLGFDGEGKKRTVRLFFAVSAYRGEIYF